MIACQVIRIAAFLHALQESERQLHIECGTR